MRLLTPRGSGGVAVVLAAPGAERATLLACLRTPRGAAVDSLPGQPPRRCVLQLDGGLGDDVLLVDREHGLELHLHGSPGLLDAVAQRFGPLTVDAPSPAAALLRTAESPAQLALALEQSSLDFDAHLVELASLRGEAKRAAIGAARARSRIARALVQPQRVVLVGAQNAGKSTLFNRLLFTERALTGPLPGLTRDPLRERTALDGYPYELVDTAGDGDVAGAVDRAAQERARVERDDASALRLLVVDGSRGPGAGDRALRTGSTLVIASKADLPPAPWPRELPCDLRLDCRDAASAPVVRAAVGAALRHLRALPPAGPVGGPAALDDAQWLRLCALDA